MTLDEKEILASINQKKLIGYKYIYNNYYASLCSFCARFSIQNSDAEDIVQDVILSLWKSKSKFNSFKALSCFLFSSIRNASLNALRNDSKMSVSDFSDESFQNLKTNGTTILDVLVEEEYFRQVHVTISNLTPKRKEVVLFTMDGLTNREIAEKVGISINTVKTLKLNAYRILRQELGMIVFLLLFLFCNDNPFAW